MRKLTTRSPPQPEEIAKLLEFYGVALCEEIGDRQDGRVQYWGMAFNDHTEIVSACGGMRGDFRNAESAHQLLSRTRTIHLLWA